MASKYKAKCAEQTKKNRINQANPPRGRENSDRRRRANAYLQGTNIHSLALQCFPKRNIQVSATRCIFVQVRCLTATTSSRWSVLKASDFYWQAGTIQIGDFVTTTFSSRRSNNAFRFTEVTMLATIIVNIG